MTCQEQLNAIFEQIKLLTQRKDAAYANLKEGLETYGVEICSYAELEKQDVEFLDAYLSMKCVRYYLRRSSERNSHFRF